MAFIEIDARLDSLENAKSYLCNPTDVGKANFVIAGRVAPCYSLFHIEGEKK